MNKRSAHHFRVNTRKASHFNNIAPVYQKGRPAKTGRVFTSLLESLIKLQPKLLNANLVLNCSLSQSYIYLLVVTIPTCDARTI